MDMDTVTSLTYEHKQAITHAATHTPAQTETEIEIEIQRGRGVYLWHLLGACEPQL